VIEQNFKRDVHAKFKEYLSVRGTATNTGECMTELFDQIRKHRVNMDGDVCTVMVTTLILEVVFLTIPLSLFVLRCIFGCPLEMIIHISKLPKINSQMYSKLVLFSFVKA
jgi:hypothetical protein